MWLPMNKREFLRTSGTAGLGLLLGARVWARDVLVKAISEIARA